MTACLGTLHAGDVLAANTAGTSVTASYNSGTGVLTLSGNRPTSEYQTVLRTIKYNNTSGGPGVDAVTVNIVANDGTSDSAPSVATITINLPVILDLNGAPAGTGFTATSTQSAAANINDRR